MLQFNNPGLQIYIQRSKLKIRYRVRINTIKNEMENEMTFEQINDHINTADLSIFKAGGEKHFGMADIKTAPGDVLQKVCNIYRVVRPVL